MIQRKQSSWFWSAGLIGIGVLPALVIGCAAAAREAQADAEIRWTRFGIPHVTAANYAGLGLGYGYAVAVDELCVLADSIVTVRGDRSRWFGPGQRTSVGFTPATNLDSDLFYRVQLADADVDSAWRKLSADARALASGYAAGYNLFIGELSPERRAAGCNGAPLQQMRNTDVVRFVMQIGAIWRAQDVAAFSFSSTRQGSTGPARVDATSSHEARFAQLSSEDPIGSNAWAYGSEVTATGAAIVVANPHTSWLSSWQRMHQLHLTIPGELDVAGADFAGLPVALAGFNKDLAWTLKSPIGVRYHVLLRLEIGADEKSFSIDGVPQPISFKPLRLEVRDADGKVSARTFDVPHTALGPIYRLPAAARRAAGWYAITDPNIGNALGLDQFIGVAKARNVQEMRSAVERHRGMTARLIAGDRHGEVLYVEAGPLLDADDSTLMACAVDAGYRDGTARGAPAVLDGSKQRCALRDEGQAVRMAAATKIPAVTSRGIVHFASTSNRYALIDRTLEGYSLLFGDSRESPGPRALMSERHIAEVLADRRVTPEEATEVMFSNRNYAAETSLDAILSACEGVESNARVARSCRTLRAWNRRNDRDSRGALLFTTVWRRLSELPDFYAQGFDPNHPYRVRAVSTDSKMTDAIRAALDAAMAELNAKGLEGDEPWGQMLARVTKQGRVPLHGGSAEEGVLNVVSGGPLGSEGYADVRYGSSYAHVVTWRDGKLDARVLLAHGQSIEPTAQHFSDQLASFVAKRLEPMPFTVAEIRAESDVVIKKVRGRIQ